MPTPDPDPAQAPHDGHLTRSARVLAVMLKLGTIAFGGPAVHIAMLRDETVRRQWLEDAELLDPFGTSSTQLAIRRHEPRRARRRGRQVIAAQS
jgi:hypothetical protein